MAETLTCSSSLKQGFSVLWCWCWCWCWSRWCCTMIVVVAVAEVLQPLRRCCLAPLSQVGGPLQRATTNTTRPDHRIRNSGRPLASSSERLCRRNLATTLPGHGATRPKWVRQPLSIALSIATSSCRPPLHLTEFRPSQYSSPSAVRPQPAREMTWSTWPALYRATPPVYSSICVASMPRQVRNQELPVQGGIAADFFLPETSFRPHRKLLDI